MKKSPVTRPGRGNPSLNESLSKLDELLSDIRENQNIPEQNQQINIPVLDDLIHPDDPDIKEEAVFHHYPSHDEDQEYKLTELIDTLENRIAGELDSVIEILKETIKDSILTELKTRINENNRELKNQIPPEE